MTQNKLTGQELLNQLEQQQKRIEELEAQLADQQQPAKLLDFVMDAVASSDADYNIQTWNKAAERLYGWTAEEVIGRNVIDLFQTEYLDGTSLDEAREKFQKEGVWRGTMLHRRKDGTQIPIRGTSSVIRDEDDQMIGSVSVLRDISDEVAAELRLAEREERYRLISELMSDYAYLYHVNDDGTWYHVWTTDDAFQRVTGYHAHQIAGTFGLYHPDEADRVRRDVERTVTGENTEGEYRIITRDGDDKWIYIRRRVLWNENHERIIGFYGAGKDITTRKQAEERLLEYHNEKERINILQDFIRDASHDLKTPLSTVNTSIYILRKLATTRRQRDQLDKLETNVNHLTKLIEDMFEMSRLDLINRLSLSYVDLNIYLRDIVTVQQLIAADHGIKLSSNLAGKPLVALIDPHSLIEAINKVIDNAIHFTPEKGHIIIHSFEEDEWIVVAIEDDGIGIPPNEIPHIFKRFYRGDKARSTTTASTGLGLSLANKIVSLHNGTIAVDSTPGEGTCVFIRLPRSQSSG